MLDAQPGATQTPSQSQASVPRLPQMDKPAPGTGRTALSASRKPNRTGAARPQRPGGRTTRVSRTEPLCCDRLSAGGGHRGPGPGRGGGLPPTHTPGVPFSSETYRVPGPDWCPAPTGTFLFSSVPFSAFPVLGTHHLHLIPEHSVGPKETSSPSAITPRPPRALVPGVEEPGLGVLHTQPRWPPASGSLPPRRAG